MIDWRELLMKYIHIVAEAEGVSFIDQDGPTPPLTDEEWAALVQCNTESGNRHAEYMATWAAWRAKNP